MDKSTRHQPIAWRFLVSILQLRGTDAPEMLRARMDDLQRMAGKGGDCPLGYFPPTGCECQSQPVAGLSAT